MDVLSVLDDVKRRGLVASMKSGAAREALAIEGWDERRDEIVVAAERFGIRLTDALAAFGLASSGSVRRLGRGEGAKRGWVGDQIRRSAVSRTMDLDVEEHARRLDAFSLRR